MTRRLLTSAAGLWLALLAWAPLAHAEEGGEEHPATWLNWLYSMRYHGHPIVHEPAQVAFAWALLLVIGLCTRGHHRRPPPDRAPRQIPESS